MSIPTAVSQLLEVENMREAGLLAADTTLAIAMSRVGAQTEGEQKIVCGTLAELAAQDSYIYGEPLHSLVIVGKRLHHLEVEFAEIYAINRESWRNVARTAYSCILD